jgi:hypothetical protein
MIVWAYVAVQSNVSNKTVQDEQAAEGFRGVRSSHRLITALHPGVESVRVATS